MTPDDFVEYERRLVAHYRDEQLAYHLARLAYRLGPRYYEVIVRHPTGSSSSSGSGSFRRPPAGG